MTKTIVLSNDKVHFGTLLLVNALCPVKYENKRGLISINQDYPDILLNCDAANALQSVFDKISAGNDIVSVSGYRSFTEQAEIYNNSLRQNGAAFTEKFIAAPGRSEHQTGLAIDLALNKQDIDFICPEFPYEGICNKFRHTACNYGFIERYPSNKETLTGISHEPWHFRYVGYPHSKIIKEKGFAFEEYIEFIKIYSDDSRFTFAGEQGMKIEIYYIPACSGKTLVRIPKECIYQISGNNKDGFIVTIWGGRCD